MGFVMLDKGWANEKQWIEEAFQVKNGNDYSFVRIDKVFVKQITIPNDTKEKTNNKDKDEEDEKIQTQQVAKN